VPPMGRRAGAGPLDFASRLTAAEQVHDPQHEAGRMRAEEHHPTEDREHAIKHRSGSRPKPAFCSTPYPTPTGVPLLHPMNLDFSKRAIFRSLNMGSLHERGHFSRRDWLVYVIVVALTIGAAVAVALV
jgi:hypothetical protein